MKKDMSNRRSIIKNIAIIFLAVLLVLTFFSNTILNYSLPEVAVQYPMYSTISSRIRGQGTVTANQTYQVYIDEARLILSAELRRGDLVQKGDVLYWLEDAPSDELNNAINTLITLNVNYKRALMDSTPDYTAILEEISELNNQLKNAKQLKIDLESNRILLAQTKNAIRISQKRSDELEAKQQQLETYLNSLEPDESLNDQQFKVALANAKMQYENAKMLLDNERENLKLQQRLLLEYSNPLLVARYNLDEKIKEKEAYTTENGNTSPVSAAELMQLDADIQSEADPVIKAQLQNEYNIKVAKYFNWLPIEDKIKEYNKAISLLTLELATVQKQYDDMDIKVKQSQNNIIVFEYGVEDAELIYFPLKARNEYPEIEEQISQTITELLLIQEQLKQMRDDEQQLESKIITDTQADALIENLQKDLDSKQKAFYKQKEQDELNGQIDKMNLENMQREITQQEALVERLKAKAVNAVITAPVSGSILNMKYVAGEKTNAGDVVAEIEITEKGYTMSFSVTTEQSRRISVGQEAEVQYYYGATAPYAVVQAIQTDYNNPQSSRIVVLEIKGDNIYPGQSINVVIGESGRDFESVIPNSAVHEDNKGKFVYIVEAKNTPIGNRYVAKRVDVQVIASDDRSSAISGVDPYSNYVITMASKPLTNGMQVRLIED